VLRIHQLFFINIVGLFIVSLLVASVISFFSLKSMIIEDSEERLVQSIEFIEPHIIQLNEYDSLASLLHEKTGFRITIIDEAGIVIAESNSDKKKMENHLNRIEVMHAMTEPYGVTIRYSNTVKSDFIYVAKKIKTNQNKSLYLRLSMSLETVMDRFYSLWIKLFSAFLGMIAVALFIAYKISLKTRSDIAQITQFLNEISAKNYHAVLKPEYFREFMQIAVMLKNLVKKLKNRDKQKRKYTAKLRLINKQQNDILSAISHEFKNPVAAIVGYTETLQDDMDLSLPIREKFLGKVHSNALKISHMLDRLALSVKLENNDLKIKPTLFNLHALCTEVVSTLNGKYPDRHIRFEGIEKEVYADQTMIELVITNLIDNAIKYSEDEVLLHLDEHTVQVTDKGIGIAPKDLEHITNKFYRVQKNRWDNSMGLGLAIVSFILKLHDTDLTIQSTFGIGSTFGFSLDSFKKPKK